MASAAIVLALRYVGESREAKSTALDWTCGLLATAGLGALTFGLTLWTSPPGLTPASVGAVGAGIANFGHLLIVAMLSGHITIDGESVSEAE